MIGKLSCLLNNLNASLCLPPNHWSLKTIDNPWTIAQYLFLYLLFCFHRRFLLFLSNLPILRLPSATCTLIFIYRKGVQGWLVSQYRVESSDRSNSWRACMRHENLHLTSLRFPLRLAGLFFPHLPLRSLPSALPRRAAFFFFFLHRCSFDLLSLPSVTATFVASLFSSSFSLLLSFSFPPSIPVSLLRKRLSTKPAAQRFPSITEDQQKGRDLYLLPLPSNLSSPLFSNLSSPFLLSLLLSIYNTCSFCFHRASESEERVRRESERKERQDDRGGRGRSRRCSAREKRQRSVSRHARCRIEFDPRIRIHKTLDLLDHSRPSRFFSSFFYGFHVGVRF